MVTDGAGSVYLNLVQFIFTRVVKYIFIRIKTPGILTSIVLITTAAVYSRGRDF